MSDIIGRTFRISKAYLNQVRDRIDAELAERELAGAADTAPSTDEGGSAGSPPRHPGGSGSDDADAMMRRAEDRIASARRDLESRKELGRAPGSRYTGDPEAAGAAAKSAASTDTDPNAVDYRILGVPVGSDLSAVQSAYEKLSRRCDPRRFPDGSEEQKDAERILARVNVAYESLRKRLDPTVNRFGKLEFE